MALEYPEPAKTDFADVENGITTRFLNYLGNHTECYKLNVYDPSTTASHIGYYSKRKAIQPAVLNEAASRGFHFRACTQRTIETDDGTKSVGYIEIETV